MDLESNGNDIKASLAKSVLGAVPLVGPFLSEVVGTVIPNQRVDRLGKFIQEVDKRLSRFEESYLNELIQDDECVDLIEESFFSASRGVSDERREYIASMLENGLSEDRIGFAESKHLLKILNELNDIEILWLRFFHRPTIGGDEEFRKKHEDVFKHVVVYVGADEETIRKGALQESYKEHIERLGLVKAHVNFDRTSGLPEYDKFTGKPKVNYRDTSTLGNTLLEYIGLI